MFHTERTDLKTCFGLSIGEAMEIVNNFNANNSNANINHLFETLGTNNANQLITTNPFAVKLLEQKEHLLAPEALGLIDSPDIIELVFKYRAYCDQTISKINSPVLETYLPKMWRSELFLPALSRNPRAVSFLAKHPELISWSSLCENPEALDLIEANPEKINFRNLSRNTNPRAIAILRENFERIEWNFLSSNSSEEAVILLLENVNKINWYDFSQNKCPLALPLIEKNIKKCNSYFVSTNPNAIRILKENPSKIYWPALCVTASTKEQFDYIRENLDKVHWDSICRNRNKRALELLMEFPERIQWHFTLGNQDVFETTAEYNYEGIREAKCRLHEEFHAWAGHPSKMSTKWIDWGFDGAIQNEDEEDAEEGECSF
jgi:hypothetical protein